MGFIVRITYIDKLNCTNRTGTLSEDVVHSRIRQTLTIIQQLHQLESKFGDLLVCSVNVGTLKGRSGEIEEMLECSVDICCVEEIRFRGKPIRVVNWKAME